MSEPYTHTVRAAAYDDPPYTFEYHGSLPILVDRFALRLTHDADRLTWTWEVYGRRIRRTGHRHRGTRAWARRYSHA